MIKSFKIDYISPSFFPSKKANSIQVIRMCESFKRIGCSIKIYGCHNKSKNNISEINEYYGCNLSNENFMLVKPFFNSYINFKIAFHYIISNKIRVKNKIIISRNFYASLILRIFSKKFIYEIHYIESGLKKNIQKFIINGANTKIVTITNQLLIDLKVKKQKDQYLVLPDCAKLYSKRYDHSLINKIINKNKKFKIGYFGSIGEGRGIELIEKLAVHFKNIEFYIFNDSLSQKYKNLNFVNYVHPAKTTLLMKEFNLLLLPYNEKIIINDKNKTNTARWMSPLKMFEYMSSGVPILSSNINSLKEILRNNVNSFIVKKNNFNSWKISINKILLNPDFSKHIAINAKNNIIFNFNWDNRARKIISLFINNE